MSLSIKQNFLILLLIFLSTDLFAGSKALVARPCANTIDIIETETDKIIKTIPSINGARYLQFKADTHEIYVIGDTSLYVIDSDTFEIKQMNSLEEIKNAYLPYTFPLTWFSKLAISNNKAFLAGNDYFGNAQMISIDLYTHTDLPYDLASIKPIFLEPEENNRSFQWETKGEMVADLDGHKLYVATSTTQPSTWINIISSNSIKDSVFIDHFVAGQVSLTPDSKELYMLDVHRKEINAMDTATNKIASIDIKTEFDPTRDYSIQSFSISPDSKKAYVSCSLQMFPGENPDGVILIINTQNHKIEKKIMNPASAWRPYEVAFLKNNEKALVTDKLGSNLFIITQHSDEIKKISLLDNAGTSLGALMNPTTTPEGNKVYMYANDSNDIIVYDSSKKSAFPVTVLPISQLIRRGPICVGPIAMISS